VARLDDVLGPGAWLICRAAFDGVAAPGVRAATLPDAALAPFRDSLAAWLDTHGADAVLVRPDRHVFGAGAPNELLDAWRAHVPTH
jgi:3-(3-hydroxy-phenyl)propionate hydroxylase